MTIKAIETNKQLPEGTPTADLVLAREQVEVDTVELIATVTMLFAYHGSAYRYLAIVKPRHYYDTSQRVKMLRRGERDEDRWIVDVTLQFWGHERTTNEQSAPRWRTSHGPLTGRSKEFTKVYAKAKRIALGAGQDALILSVQSETPEGVLRAMRADVARDMFGIVKSLAEDLGDYGGEAEMPHVEMKWLHERVGDLRALRTKLETIDGVMERLGWKPNIVADTEIERAKEEARAKAEAENKSTETDNNDEGDDR